MDQMQREQCDGEINKFENKDLYFSVKLALINPQ